jgi:hypothetical protein
MRDRTANRERGQPATDLTDRTATVAAADGKLARVTDTSQQPTTPPTATPKSGPEDPRSLWAAP